jgi:thiamine-monophosphate kinase
MAISEFQLIERYFTRQPVRRRETVLGVGDDCALLSVPPGMTLAVTMDTLVEGRHFPETTAPRDVGHKALAVNLSDLAAMGAQPAWATLSLCLPEPDEAWLTGFAEGLFALAARFGVELVGGDTVRGPRVLTLQLHGWVPEGAALTRSGARPGDGVFVTGTLGDAGAGLAIVAGKISCGSADAQYLRGRLDRPEPRVEAGLALRGVASAAIDVSDGVAADLTHILERSGVGATLWAEALPLSAALARICAPEQARRLALSAGDDYELCFTVPPERIPELSRLPVACTQIGVIEPVPGLRLVDATGRSLAPGVGGYDHFAGHA